jgi:hypothetical protein
MGPFAVALCMEYKRELRKMVTMRRKLRAERPARDCKEMSFGIALILAARRAVDARSNSWR